MKRIITISLVRIVLLFVAAKPVVSAELEQLAYTPPITTSKPVDSRIAQLESYLEKHNSPLAPHAGVFIQKADQYGIPDWKLVPAIAGVESTFGKKIPANSFNAYGWANGKYAFKNWEESVDVVTRTLKQKYIDRGLTTPETMSRVYAPPSTTWAGKVRFFMSQIDNHVVVDSPKSLPFTL